PYGKTAAQVALNYLIWEENVVAIPKAGRKEHIEENAGAMGWRLSKEDREKARGCV
ncbi:aldo/keto reductase, partial [Thermococcus thioreducens]